LKYEVNPSKNSETSISKNKLDVLVHAFCISNHSEGRARKIVILGGLDKK
jgi:hypothetical protein